MQMNNTFGGANNIFLSKYSAGAGLKEYYFEYSSAVPQRILGYYFDSANNANSLQNYYTTGYTWNGGDPGDWLTLTYDGGNSINDFMCFRNTSRQTRTGGVDNFDAMYPWQPEYWIYRSYRSCMNYGYTYILVDYSDGDFSSDATIDIGAFNYDGTPGQYPASAIIDEVAIYNRALSELEIYEHYDKGLIGIGYCE